MSHCFSPKGIPYVLVNGRLVVDNGEHTGARPGRVIYGSGKRDRTGAEAGGGGK